MGLAQRSLTLQPGNSLISPKLTLSVGFTTSIALHAATQAIRLRRSGTSLTSVRVTLWITTAIHLDTPNIMSDPMMCVAQRLRARQRRRYLLLGLPCVDCGRARL